MSKFFLFNVTLIVFAITCIFLSAVLSNYGFCNGRFMDDEFYFQRAFEELKKKGTFKDMRTIGGDGAYGGYVDFGDLKRKENNCCHLYNVFINPLEFHFGRIRFNFSFIVRQVLIRFEGIYYEFGFSSCGRLESATTDNG